MQFLNKTSLSKKQIAYLGALTLLFSYAELFLPRFAFFKIGLSNIVILASLQISFVPFLILCFVKATAASLMAGTLLSPFYLISILQSVLSGLLMYGLNKIFKNRKFISLYGISMTGSAFSSLIQIYAASVYLGKGTIKLLGPFLIFSTFTGVLTAFFAIHFELENLILNQLREENSNPEKNLSEIKKENLIKPKQILIILAILISVVIIFISKNIYTLCGFFAVSVIFQLLSKRKFLFLPHLLTWIFILFCCAFYPNGKVLFHFRSLSITEGAILESIKKALQLSSVMCLSQCAASLKFPSYSLLGMCLKNFDSMSSIFKNTKSNLWQKIKAAIRMNNSSI